MKLLLTFITYFLGQIITLSFCCLFVYVFALCFGFEFKIIYGVALYFIILLIQILKN